jgi:putative membrane protein
MPLHEEKSMRNRFLLIALVALTTACIRINNDREIFEDPQVAMVMRVANISEVREGTVARDKATEPAVRDFAAMMVSEHGTANSKAEAELAKEYVSSMDSPLSRQLDAESGAATDRLRNLTGRAFDRAYMQREVEAHQNLLDLIDKRLKPVAKEKVLKEQLTSMRATVQEHLTKAQQILASLPN